MTADSQYTFCSTVPGFGNYPENIREVVEQSNYEYLPHDLRTLLGSSKIGGWAKRQRTRENRLPFIVKDKQSCE